MSNSRKMERNAAKNAYRKFCRTFVAAKRGGADLRKRPTFKEWWRSVRQPSAFDATPEEVQEHIEDLEWDD